MNWILYTYTSKAGTIECHAYEVASSDEASQVGAEMVAAAQKAGDMTFGFMVLKLEQLP